MLREDNADLRLMGIGHDLGLIDDHTLKDIQERKSAIEKEKQRIKTTVMKPAADINTYLEDRGTKPLPTGVHLDQLLRRAELDYNLVRKFAEAPTGITPKVARQVEIEIKYEGYIDRQLREIEKFKHLEQIRVPDDFDYTRVHGLSNELKEKLTVVKPASLGQASRMDGITPAAISVLMITLKAVQKKTPTDNSEVST